MAETVVGAASPSLSVSAPSSGRADSAIPGSSLTANLLGGASPSGTVTFKVFGPQSSPPSDCSGGRKVGTASVSGNGSYNPSAGFTPTQAGDYWWYAIYSGDSNNNAAASKCRGSIRTVVAPAESTLTVDPVSVSGSTARVPLSCQGTAPAGCAAKLKLETTDPAASSDVVTVGRADVTLTNGQSMTVKLQLNRMGERLLKMRGGLQTKLVVVQSGNVVAHKIITFQRS
jgi:hypothetical protein